MAKRSEQEIADEVTAKGGKIARDLEEGRTSPGKAWADTSKVVLDGLKENASDG